MKLLFVLVVLCAGCATTWQDQMKTSLAVSEIGIISAHTIGRAIFDKRCTEAAYDCEDAGICEKLKECKGDYQAFADSVMGLLIACEAAEIAIRVGDKAKAQELVARALTLWNKIEGTYGGYLK